MQPQLTSPLPSRPDRDQEEFAMIADRPCPIPPDDDILFYDMMNDRIEMSVISACHRFPSNLPGCGHPCPQPETNP